MGGSWLFWYLRSRSGQWSQVLRGGLPWRLPRVYMTKQEDSELCESRRCFSHEGPRLLKRVIYYADASSSKPRNLRMCRFRVFVLSHARTYDSHHVAGKDSSYRVCFPAENIPRDCWRSTGSVSTVCDVVARTCTTCGYVRNLEGQALTVSFPLGLLREARRAS